MAFCLRPDRIPDPRAAFAKVSSAIRDIARAAAAALAAVALGSGAGPGWAGEQYPPQIGHPGRDVFWVPTPERAIERMLVMAGVGPDEFPVDLASGDSRIVIAAARLLGARGFGVDLDPQMVRLSEYRARRWRNDRGRGDDP